MPTFTPPTVPNVGLDATCPGESPWRFYKAPDRGLNLWKYTDGTYELTDAWPYVTDGVGKTVGTAYYGAHSYTVSTAEAAAITAFLATLGITANIV